MNESAERVPPLTITQAAVRAKVSERTVTRWIAAGLLPARKNKINGRVSIDPAHVDAIIAGEPVAPAPAAG